MNKPEWIETKKECDVDGDGKMIIKKVTLERMKRNYLGLEKKDIIDISIRLISLGAIFIPLLLFYKQQKAERDKQKSFFQFELYSNTTTELHSLTNKSLGSLEFDQAKNKLLYEIYPKLTLLSENVVTDTFLVLKDIIDFSSTMSKAFNNSDSLKKQVRKFGETGNNKPGNNNEHEMAEVLSPYIQNVRSSETEILRWKSATKVGRSFTGEHQRMAVDILFSLRRDVDALVKKNRLNTLAYDSAGRFSRLPSTTDSSDTNAPEAAALEYVFRSFDRIHSLKNSYTNQYNNQIQYYTLKLDSIMVESTKQLYSK